MFIQWTRRLSLAIWRSPTVRRFLFQQARRVITAAILNRAMTAEKQKHRDGASERVVIPVVEETS